MRTLLLAFVTLSLAVASPEVNAVNLTSQVVDPGTELRTAIRAHDAVRVASLLTMTQPKGIDIAALMEVAIECEDVAIVRLLLEQGADPNRGVGGGFETALMTAARVGASEITKVLLGAGADPNGRGGLGTAAAFPLYYAVNYRNRRTALILLGAKADPNARVRVSAVSPPRDSEPREGKTCLMVAVSQGDSEMVEWLLHAGADVSLIDENGRRAIDYLKDHENAARRIKTLLTGTTRR